MREQKKTVAGAVERIFLILFGSLLIIVTGICVQKPQHNLIPTRMIAFTLVWLIILYLGRCILGFVAGWIKHRKKEKLLDVLLVVFFLMWALLLFLTGCTARCYPHTDFENVYRAADALARKQEVDNWVYFSRWTNNRFPMLFLSGLLCAGYHMGFEDAYYFVLAYQVIHIVITAACLYHLAGSNKTEMSLTNSLTVLMLLFLFTPVWGNVAFFYTDQLSFGYSIIAYTFVSEAIKGRYTPYAKYALLIAGGVLWAIAFQIKVTTAIPLMAIAVAVIIRKKYVKQLKALLVFVLAFLLTFAIGTMRVKVLPCEANVERDSDPILYWVALGLHGDGSHAANEDFAILCEAAGSKTEREYIVKEKLRREWRQFFDSDHIIAKIRCNFACGDVGASGYMRFPYKEGNIVYELISWDGKFFWKYACLSTSYLFALFLLTAIGAFRGAFGNKMNFTTMTAYVTVIGIMLFLMLWEAQNKQLFNQTGWILLAACHGLLTRGTPKKCFVGRNKK